MSAGYSRQPRIKPGRYILTINGHLLLDCFSTCEALEAANEGNEENASSALWGQIALNNILILDGLMGCPWSTQNFLSLASRKIAKDEVIRKIALRNLDCSPRVVRELLDALSRLICQHSDGSTLLGTLSELELNNFSPSITSFAATKRAQPDVLLGEDALEKLAEQCRGLSYLTVTNMNELGDGARQELATFVSHVCKGSEKLVHLNMAAFSKDGSRNEPGHKVLESLEQVQSLQTIDLKCNRAWWTN